MARKPTIHVRCKGCGKKTSTTRTEAKDDYLCQNCRKYYQKPYERPEKGLFRKFLDWLAKIFGSG